MRAHWHSLIALVIMTGAGPAVAADPAVPLALADELQVLSTEAAADGAIRTFYQDRNTAPLWVDAAGFNAAARSVISEMAKADDWGLERYDVAPPGGDKGSDLADAELRLTRTILRYIDAAHGGRILEPSKQLSSYLDRQPRLPDPLTVLREIAVSQDPSAYLLTHQPQQAEFKRLQALYAKLRNGQREDTIVPSGPQLREGMEHVQVLLLKKRLGLTTDTTRFDAALRVAVMSFQRDRGLRPIDGVVGPRTRKALNAGSNVANLETLLANMEQWRWMPADLGSTHVLVNVPEFSAQLIKDGNAIFSERVIVGKPETQTPVFSKNMRSVVLHPRWQVPETIKLKEFLPTLLRGGTLESRGYSLERDGKVIPSRKVNWRKADIRAYQVFQGAGDDNALGQVKFLFPNQHAVYLHDTPSRGLFRASERLFSHGCVRLANPIAFAKLILHDDKGWDGQQVAELTDNGPFDNVIRLDRPFPVHITYFTARVADDGTLKTFRDVYGHEKRITLALKGRWAEIDKGRDHLAPVDMAEIRRNATKMDGASRGVRRANPDWGAPMGLFGGMGGSQASSGTTANDIFRRSFGN